MIAKLYGIIDEIEADSLIINVGGVGYLVFASSRTLMRLPPKGAEAVLFIETVVREDNISLYGFVSAAEKRCFNTLTTVQGVGARVALAILSAFAPDELEMAIGAGDAKTLCKANGVGNKLALRIITELKGKMGVGLLSADMSAVALGAGGGAGAGAGASGLGAEANSPVADAVSALVNLGYSRLEAVMVINKIAAEGGKTTSEMIKAALKEFAK